METSRIRLETKTVQILLWPGRRPSFHFNHFETKLLKLFWFSPSLELHVLTGYIFFIFYWNSSREAHMKCIHRPSTWTLSREAHIECTHRPSTRIPVFIFSSSLCPDFVHLHLFLMIQLSVVILETHTVWIRLISTKDGKMETSRIRLETKTVQILLWPGRRPGFHFNHFKTNSSWYSFFASS